MRVLGVTQVTVRVTCAFCGYLLPVWDLSSDSLATVFLTLVKSSLGILHFTDPAFDVSKDIANPCAL